MNNGQIIASVLGTALLSAGLIGVVSSAPQVQLAAATMDTGAPPGDAAVAPAAQNKPAPAVQIVQKQKPVENDGKETLAYDGKETLPDGKETLGKEVIGEPAIQPLLVDAAPVGPPAEHQYIPPKSSSPLLSPPTPVNVSGPVVSPDNPIAVDFR